MATATATTDVKPDLYTSPIIPFGGQRSNWFYPHPRAAPDSSVKVRNINFSERGTADRRRGYTPYGDVLGTAEAFTGLYAARFADGTIQRVEVTPDRVYTHDGDTRKNITGSLSFVGGNDDRTRFTFISDQIVGTDGVNETWTWDGDFSSPSSAAALAGVPWTTCRDVVAHKGVLVALGPTESGTYYPTRLRWSDVDARVYVPDITVWRDDSRYEVYEGSAPIVGGLDNWSTLFVFKEDGMYPGSLQIEQGFIEFRPDVAGIRRGFQPIARHTLVAHPNFLWGVAREGAFVVRPDYTVEIVTRDVQNEWNGLNLSRLQYAQSWRRDKDHQIRTLLSSGTNSTGHDLLMIYDWETGQVAFDELTDSMNVAAQLYDSDAEYDWMGGYSSNYAYLGNTTIEDNAKGFTWEIETHPNDLGLPGTTKHFVDLIIHYRTVGGQQKMTCEVIRNQGDLLTRTKVLTLGDNLKYDTGLQYDTGLKYPGGTNTTVKFHLNRNANNIALRLTGNDDVNLIGYQVTYTVREEN